MAAQDFSPCSTDILQASKYILSFPRISATQFFCQSVNLPGVNTQFATFATPLSDLPIPGDKLFYDPLSLEFLIDEELQSWTVIYDWMKGLAYPDNPSEYKNLGKLSRFSQNVKHPQYADAELIILSANNNPKVKIHFIDIFPIALSGFQMDLRVDSSHIMTATGTFKFSRYTIEQV